MSAVAVVDHVPATERAEVINPVQPSANRQTLKTKLGTYGGLRAAAGLITTKEDVVSAASIAHTMGGQAKHAVEVVCYRMLDLGLTAKATIHVGGLKLGEDSVLNRASVGRAIAVHGASEDEAVEIAKGINRTWTRSVVRARVAADDCDVAQLVAYIKDNARKPASDDATAGGADEPAEQAPATAGPATLTDVLMSFLDLAHNLAVNGSDEDVASFRAALNMAHDTLESAGR